MAGGPKAISSKRGGGGVRGRGAPSPKPPRGTPPPPPTRPGAGFFPTRFFQARAPPSRHSNAPEDVIFTQALFQGRSGDVAAITAQMDDIAAKRKASQPPNKTCGSTFKNPPGGKAWQLIDAAGCRGLTVGGAQ